MHFVNDTTHPPGIGAIVRQAMQQFHTADEVRFAWDATELAPILNALAEIGTKFYLVCLPDQTGWVLRRHRPTGQHYGRPPTDSSFLGLDPAATDLAPHAVPLDLGDKGEGSGPGRVAAPEQHNGPAPQYAEEYFRNVDKHGFGNRYGSGPASSGSFGGTAENAESGGDSGV